MKSFFKHFHFYYLLFIPIILGFILALLKIMNGEFPLWYDNARDLLLAQANLSKLSLIGPTGGIPGIFYGPYWIWMLSLAMLLHKDAAFITFVVITLPYFILFPLGLFLLKRVFSVTILLVMFSLFLLTQSAYINSLWNPHLFPAIFFLMIAVLQTVNYKNTIGDFFRTFLVGIIAALTFQFSMSIGTAVLIGTGVFILSFSIISVHPLKTDFYQKIRTIILRGLFFAIGVFILFIPFITFEIRHGFHQLQIFFHTLLQSNITVGPEGFSDPEKITFFLGKLSNLLQIPAVFSVSCLILMGGFFAWILIRKKPAFTFEEMKLFSFLVWISWCILALYYVSQNAIWAYHYIGVEIIFLLFLGLLLNKFKFLFVPIVIWIFILVLQLQIIPILQQQSVNTAILGGYGAKKNIIEKIIKHSGNIPSDIAVYSSAIYTYDYDYLLQSESQTQILTQIKNGSPSADTVYLVIPETDVAYEEDFINNKTPPSSFETQDVWNFPDKTKVYIRVRRKE